eukprot:s2625_g1.t1
MAPQGSGYVLLPMEWQLSPGQARKQTVAATRVAGSDLPSKRSSESWSRCLQSYDCQTPLSFTNFMNTPRGRLVLASQFVENVDARFVGRANPVEEEVWDFLVLNNLTDQRVSHLEEAQWSYAINVDGTGSGDRIYWQMLMHKVVLVQESAWVSWLLGPVPPEGPEAAALRPWEHYLPLRMDLADLSQRLRWLDAQPEAERIAERAARWAREFLSYDWILYYLDCAVRRYAEFHFDPATLLDVQNASTAHEGFAKTAQKLLKEIEGILREELAAHPTYHLVFCGHSMGGALGAMCVAILRAKASIPETRAAYTWAKGCRAFGIGTPAVLSRNLGESLAQQQAVYTLVNAQDWSPRASLSNATELLDDLCELSVARTVARLVSGAPYGGGSNGSGSGEPPEAEVEHLPPGVILQIVPGKETKLLKASVVDYRHSFPAWPDVAAHIPLAYIEGLAIGLRQYIAADFSRAYCQPAAYQALGRVMDAAACCDKAKLPNFPDQARLVVTEQLKHLGGSSLAPL